MMSDTTALFFLLLLWSVNTQGLELNLCSKLIHQSAMYPEIALELYEDFLATMFRNSSNGIPAKSTFMQNADYYASADVLDTLDFFVQSLPYLSHQYDERDLILYMSWQNADQINILRNWQMSPEQGLCHKLVFSKRDGQQELTVRIVLNLELYDKYEDFSSGPYHSIEALLNKEEPFKFDILPGEHKMMANQKIKQQRLSVSSQQGFAALKAYLDRLCTLSTSRYRKQQLEAKYKLNACSRQSENLPPEELAFIDEYMKENLAIINLVE